MISIPEMEIHKPAARAPNSRYNFPGIILAFKSNTEPTQRAHCRRIFREIWQQRQQQQQCARAHKFDQSSSLFHMATLPFCPNACTYKRLTLRNVWYKVSRFTLAMRNAWFNRASKMEKESMRVARIVIDLIRTKNGSRQLKNAEHPLLMIKTAQNRHRKSPAKRKWRS